MFARSLFVVTILAAGQAAAAEAGEGRYQLERAGDGFIRLDRDSGTVAYCAAANGAWVCEPAKNGSMAISPDIDARLSALEQRLAALEKKSTSSGLPTDQQIDRMLDIFGKVLDRVKDFAKEVDGK